MSQLMSLIAVHRCVETLQAPSEEGAKAALVEILWQQNRDALSTLNIEFAV